MLTQLIQLYRMRFVKYEGIKISPILYHGTNDRYLRDNTKEGIYSRPKGGDPCIHTTADIWIAVERSKDAQFYNSTPKLLVIDVRSSLEGLWDRLPSSYLTLFKYLKSEHFLALDLEGPATAIPYVPTDEIVEHNRSKIEDSTQKILRLKRKIPLEYITGYTIGRHSFQR